METFRDLIARMAIDAEFARHARANPDAVAHQYRLSPDESEQLRGLADAAASAGPTALGARLSKMGGLTSSSLIDSLHLHAEPISHGPAIDPAVHHVDLPTVDPVVVHLNPHPIDPVVVHLDLHPAAPSGDPVPPRYPGDMFGDNDGDGIPNFIDPTPDGTPHPKFTNVHVGLLGPVINVGGDTSDPTPPPADGGDSAPPPDAGDHTPPPGDHHDSPPVDTGTPVVSDVPQPQAAEQQPIMLADDALAKPAPKDDGGLGEEALIIGGAALAGGAIVGGVAGVVLNRGKSTDEE